MVCGGRKEEAQLIIDLILKPITEKDRLFGSLYDIFVVACMIF